MRVTPLDEMTRERLRYRGPGRLVIREVVPGSNGGEQMPTRRLRAAG